MFATSNPFACLERVTGRGTLKHQVQSTWPLQQKTSWQLLEGTLKYSCHEKKGTTFSGSIYSQQARIKQRQPAPAHSNDWSKPMHANRDIIDGPLL